MLQVTMRSLLPRNATCLVRMMRASNKPHRAALSLFWSSSNATTSNLSIKRSSNNTNNIQHTSGAFYGCKSSLSLSLSSLQQIRWLTTPSTQHGTPYQRIQIHYASQTGTAQFLAMQLAQALSQQLPDKTTQVVNQCMDQSVQDKDNFPLCNDDSKDKASTTLHLFVVSTAGVGEFPHNGQAFYDALVQDDTISNTATNTNYAIFALGNQQAHPANYCAAGKALDKALGEHGVLPLTLGDDGNPSQCIEDAFDEWQDQVLQLIVGSADTDTDEAETASDTASADTDTTSTTTSTASSSDTFPSLTSLLPTERSHFPPLDLLPPPPIQPPPCQDLIDVCPEFYQEGCRQRFRVVANQSLQIKQDPTLSGSLHELQLQLMTNDNNNNDNTSSLHYETGDHLLVYPRNPDSLVRAMLLHVVDPPVDPHTIVAGTNSDDSSSFSNYPHPLGISVYQTLSHTIDLQAPPSKAFAKWLLGDALGHNNYSHDILQPHRTVLDICMELDIRIPLQDLLYQLPPLKPRYYSIASSSIVHPDTVYLTYRPIEYYTSRGVLRHGLCTTHLLQSGAGGTLVAGIVNNPKFRLPEDPETPIVLIGGGCGVAPLRAFLEELVARRGEQATAKNVHLFLGFRHAQDQVYQELIQQAKPLLAYQRILFASGCQIGSKGNSSSALIGQALEQQADTLKKAVVEQKGHVYVCGGATTFGAAIRKSMTKILGEQEGADIVTSGRWHEDLSD